MSLPVHVPGSTNNIQIPVLGNGQSGKNAHFFHCGEQEITKYYYYKLNLPHLLPWFSQGCAGEEA